MRTKHFVWGLLLFLCLEPVFSQVGEAASISQNSTQLLSQTESQYGLSSIPADFTTFAAYAKGMESKLIEWGSKYTNLFGSCMSGNSLGDSQRQNIEQQLVSLYAPVTENGKLVVANAKKLLKGAPLIEFLTDQLKDRPDFTKYFLDSAQQTYLGQAILGRYFQWIGEENRLTKQSPNRLDDQVLLQTTTAAAPSAFGALSAFMYLASSGQSKKLVREFSGQVSLLELEASGHEHEHEGEDEGPFKSMYDSSGGEEHGMLFSSASSSVAQSSSGGSSGSSAGGGGGGGTGGGAGGGGGGSSSGSSDGSSGGGGGRGCCGALTLIIFLLGMGCAGEYYAHNMHRFDGDKYEEYLKTNIDENVKQLTEYLEKHKEKLELLKEKMNGADGDDDDGEGHEESGVSVATLMKIPLDYAKITKKITPKTEDSSDSSKGEAEKSSKQLQSSMKEIAPKILGAFYAGYSVVPAIVNRQFGFYLTMLLLALVLSTA